MSKNLIIRQLIILCEDIHGNFLRQMVIKNLKVTLKSPRKKIQYNN